MLILHQFTDVKKDGSTRIARVRPVQIHAWRMELNALVMVIANVGNAFAMKGSMEPSAARPMRYSTVTTSIPEEEETPEDGLSENNEAEEKIEDTVSISLACRFIVSSLYKPVCVLLKADTDEKIEHDDTTAPAPETTENDDSPEPGTPEEATSASNIISVSRFTTLIALALI
uniref:SAG family member n=1 Tax=Angiostrongylus cantonensis TaxID=6313 RepID=A0A0K0D555_ANGCA